MNHDEQVNYLMSHLPKTRAHYKNLKRMRSEAIANNNADGKHQVGQKILKLEQIVGPFVLDAWRNNEVKVDD